MRRELEDSATRDRRAARNILQGVAITLVAAATIAMVVELFESRTFRLQGNRCTGQRCAEMAEQIALLTYRLDRLKVPPDEVSDALENLQAEDRRLQRQIDRLEGAVPGVTGKPLPPYSSRPPIVEAPPS